MNRYDTFSSAVEAFLSQATYLTDDDAPMITALTIIAKHLDDGDSPSTRLLSEYGVISRYLAKRSSAQADADDDEAYLQGL